MKRKSMLLVLGLLIGLLSACGGEEVNDYSECEEPGTEAENNPDAEKEPGAEVGESVYTVRIGVLNRGDSGLSLYYANEQSGMKSSLYEYPSDYEALSTELMAGNPEVDIYVFNSRMPLALLCRNMGYYCSLNESTVLTEHINGCFPGIRDAAVTDAGDYWMFPLSGDTDMVWYVPENMEKYGVEPEELETITGFMAVAERLQGQLKLEDCHFYVNTSFYFLDSFDTVYDLNYNDYDSGKVDFNTKTYRELADQLWTGWDLYGMPPVDSKHPLFWTDAYEASLTGEPLRADYNRANDITRTIFSFTPTFEYLRYNSLASKKRSTKALTGWRVMSVPKINSATDKTPMSLGFAIINPYSEHKKEAIAFLEAIAQNYKKTVREPNFLMQDISYYEEGYDVTLPAFQDLYNIYGNAAVAFGHSWDQSPEYYLLDYQHGLTSFDRAIERRQERATAELEE